MKQNSLLKTIRDAQIRLYVLQLSLKGEILLNKILQVETHKISCY